MLYCFQPGMWTTKIQMLKGTLGPRIALTRSSRMAVTMVYVKVSQVLQFIIFFKCKIVVIAVFPSGSIVFFDIFLST